MGKRSKLLFLHPDLVIKYSSLSNTAIVYLWSSIILMMRDFLGVVDAGSRFEYTTNTALTASSFVLSLLMLFNSIALIIILLNRPHNGYRMLKGCAISYASLYIIYYFAFRNSSYIYKGGFIIAPLFTILFALYVCFSTSIKYYMLYPKSAGKNDYNRFCSYNRYYENYDPLLYYFSTELYAAHTYSKYYGDRRYNTELLLDIYFVYWFIFARKINKEIVSEASHLRSNVMKYFSPGIKTKQQMASYNAIRKISKKEKDTREFIYLVAEYLCKKHNNKNMHKVIYKDSLSYDFIIYENDISYVSFCKEYFKLLCDMCYDGLYEIHCASVLFDVMGEKLFLDGPLIADNDNSNGTIINTVERVVEANKVSPVVPDNVLSAKESSKNIDAEHNGINKGCLTKEPVKNNKGIVKFLIEAADNDKSGILYGIFSIIGFILMLLSYALVMAGAKVLAEFIGNLLFH